MNRDHTYFENQLRKHWNWIRLEEDYMEAARLLEAFSEMDDKPQKPIPPLGNPSIENIC